MISKEQIDSWLKINATGENNTDNDLDAFSMGGLKVKLVEAKVLVDRWVNVSTDIIFHTSKKDFVREKLGKDLYKAPNLDAVKLAVKTLVAALDSGDISKEAKKIAEVGKLPVSECDTIWGATIHYSDDCPVDKGIMVSLADGKLQDQDDESRSIAVFPM